MKFSISTEDFSSSFSVLDSEGLERYLVKNDLDSVMRKLTITDLADNVVCTVEKKFLSLRPTYEIYNQNKQLVLHVRKKLNLLHPQFTISSELDENKFHTKGNYFASDFAITTKNEDEIISKVTRKGGYVLEILDNEHDPLAVIAVVIVIHLCCHMTKDE